MKSSQSFLLKYLFTLLLSSYCISAHAEVDVDAAKALAKQSNCFRCHGVDKDKDGPSFVKSAAKFKTDPKAAEKLLHHLTSGEAAKFPDGHEEAHAILKVDDVKEINNLVAWILSQ